MAVTPNTITVEFDRSLQEVPTYKAWQASPLKVSCSFPSGSSDTLSDVTTLTLEIRTSRTTSDAAVCSKALSTPFGNAPWVFELDSADMNLTIPEDLEQAKFFMQIVATMDDGDLDVLAAGDLVVYDNNFDGASVDPPGTVTYASASFTTIAVSGQSNVVADSATDTLTLAAGNSSIVITTNASTDTVTFSLGSTIITTTVQASGSSGLMFHTSGGSDVLILGAGGGVNATAYGTWNFDGATANTIASFGASKGLTSLSTSTYPSLTELSYVKGVTSAVQTQLDGKAASSHTHVSADVTDATTGGNYTSDSGKLAKYDASGDMRATTLRANAGLVAGAAGVNDGFVSINNEVNAAGSVSIFATDFTAAHIWNHPVNTSGTYASREWANGGNITSLGTVTTGTWNANVIGSSYGGAGTVSGLLKANGSGTVSAAVAGTDYLTPSGDGSGLTALNATQLTSGTIPDARLSSNVALLSGATFTGAILTAAGTASAPALAFSADADGSGTGIYRSAANELSIATNGTQRLKVDSAGQTSITATTTSTSTSTGALIVGGGVGVGGAIYTNGAINGGALVIASHGFAPPSGGVVKLLGDLAANPASRLAFQFTPSSTGAAIGISGTTLTAQRGDGSAGGTFATSGGVTRAISIKTTTYTVTANDHFIIGNHATVAFTVTLIAASSNTGREFIFMNKGAANMTIDGTSLGQITNAAANNTIVLTTGQSLRIISDGATWISY